MRISPTPDRGMLVGARRDPKIGEQGILIVDGAVVVRVEVSERTKSLDY